MFGVGFAELLMVLFMVAAPLVLILLAAVTIRGAVGGSRRNAGGPSAEEILSRRYANGEITREEYLNIRDDMTRNRDA